MMNPLKYGTLVLAGLATIGGIYYESTARFQVYAKDYIEIIEGVREREYIATAISGTNSVNILIATNRAAIQALDAVISNLAPYFVNQTRIADWLATTNRAPYRWTYTDLRDNVGKELGAYPLQTNQKELIIRFAYLKLLIYTDDTCDWYDTKNGVNYNGAGTEYALTNYDFFVSQWSSPFVTDITNIPQAELWWSNNSSNDPSWWITCLGTSVARQAVADWSSLGNSGATFPFFDWSISLEMQIQHKKYADFDYNRDSGGNMKWAVSWYDYINLITGLTASYRKSKMIGSARNLSLTREDTFYLMTNYPVSMAYCLNITNVSSNVTSSTTYDYVYPAFSSFTYNSPYLEVCATEHPHIDYGYSINRIIDYSDTNRVNHGVLNTNLYSSGATSNTLLRNVIHKWDVTRCRP